MKDIGFAKVFLLSYLVWLAMGSRANTIAHATSILHGSEEQNDLRESLVKVIARGTSLALNQCKEQFRWERWNCPQSLFYRNNGEPVTREDAFVSSITSAGIVYAVTRACTKGSLATCDCSKRRAPILLGNNYAVESSSNEDTKHDWSWSGCSDDVSFGDRVAHTFLTSLQEGQADVLAKVHLHNNRLGRMIVREHVRPECKCHGVSGSCGTKTCWFKLAPFDEVGAVLKHRYMRAQRIQVNTAARNSDLNIPESQMIFLENSPDFCKPNSTLGWPGTGGRICLRGRETTRSKPERRSCKELCRSCGHQVKQRPLKITWHCNCTFHWCCEVKCNTCIKTLMQHYCDDAPKHFRK